MVTLRDFAAALTTLCGLASILVEPSIINAVSLEPTSQASRTLQRVLWMVPVETLVSALFFLIVSQSCVHSCSHMVLYTHFILSAIIQQYMCQIIPPSDHLEEASSDTHETHHTNMF
jgi:hypothetical protein